MPPPKGDADAPLRALIFDSHYDSYKGVIAYVRLVDGALKGGERITHDGRPAATPTSSRSAIFGPDMTRDDAADRWRGRLRRHRPQERRAIARSATRSDAGRRGRRRSRCPATGPPSRWSSPASTRSKATTIRLLRDALERLQLNDAALVFEPETSVALGFGFRCGFLGLLHMEIVQERLEREYNLDLLATAPSVEYQSSRTTSGEAVSVDNPSDLPPAGRDRRDRRAVDGDLDHHAQRATSARSWTW